MLNNALRRSLEAKVAQSSMYTVLLLHVIPMTFAMNFVGLHTPSFPNHACCGQGTEGRRVKLNSHCG